MLLIGLSVVSMFVYASEAVDEFVASKSVDAESVSVYVYDLKRQKQIEGYNERKPLIPASITKCLTVASTIRSIGIDYRYRTLAYIDGKVRNGTLDGNLYIIGSGDPTINGVVAPEGSDFIEELILALEKRNISCISGQVIVDQSCFPLPAHPSSWNAEDMKRDYGAGAFGFNYKSNSSGRWSIANPAEVFRNDLKRALANRYIELLDNNLPQSVRHLLVEHISPSIDDIMRQCIRRSDNMFAEVLLRTFAMYNDVSATPVAGTRLELNYWKRRGVELKDVTIVDGSGLSRQNRMTALFLGQILQEMSDNEDYVSYFPLAGQEGTLRNFLKGTLLDSFIALKTGSMNGIQCYAGYKLDYYYRPTHVAVVMVNNIKSDRGTLRRDVEKMLLKIFEEEIQKDAMMQS